MLDVIIDTLIDVLKLIPFLFVVFLFMEYLERSIGDKTSDKIKDSGKFGPLFGSLLGAIPQCGFGVAATNLYATRIITLGTLFSIYLSTSDEMLPIFISQKLDIKFILIVIFIKIIIGMIVGFIIDFILRNKNKDIDIKDFCDDDNCDCEHSSLFKSSVHHTINIVLFILIVEFVLNTVIYFIGEDSISNLIMGKSIFSPFVTSVFGLIPNCASSVIITELYINSAINFGALIGGLLTGSGVAILILFRVNKDIKENIKIVTMLYLIGSLFGLIINLINFI